jgi:FixJ family two-component response regulator
MRSGFDLYEGLWRAGARTPVIFITARDDELTRDRAHRAGAVAYLSKPFDEQMVIDAVGRAVAVSENGRGLRRALSRLGLRSHGPGDTASE